MSQEKYKNSACNNLNSIQSQAKGRCTQFLNQGKLFDYCHIYIATPYNDRSIRKFGVTNKLDQRGHYFYTDLVDLVSIRSGTRLLVACIERDLKIHLNQNNEYISKEQETDVIDYINNYRISEDEYYSRGVLVLEY
jgi:hypothetical protein